MARPFRNQGICSFSCSQGLDRCVQTRTKEHPKPQANMAPDSQMPVLLEGSEKNNVIIFMYKQIWHYQGIEYKICVHV